LTAIAALAAKDLGEMFRNKFTALITILVIVVIPILYSVLPSEVEETMTLGFFAPGLEGLIRAAAESQEGLRAVFYNDTSSVEQAVLDGEVSAGLVIPASFPFASPSIRPRITVVVASSIPRGTRRAVEILAKELLSALMGRKPKAILDYEIVGEDMVGRRLPYRDQYKPMWITMVLLVELISLSFLIIEEIQGGAIYAILVTPVSSGQVFAAKTLVGMMLASGEGIAVLALMGQFTSQVALLPLTVNIALGALLATGFAFLVSSVSRDVMSSMSWMLLCYLILLIPPIAVVFPSVSSPLLRILPSFYLADAFNQLLNFGAGFSDVAGDFAFLVLADCVLLCLGSLALKRRFE